MVRRMNLLLLVLSFVFIFADKAFAQGEDHLKVKKRKIFLSVELQSRMYFWEIEKNDISLTDTKYFKKGSYSPVEKVNAEPGISLGPEIELFLSYFFIRGHYIQGRYRFDVGDIKRADMGVDFGVEYANDKARVGLFVGWRSMQVLYENWTSVNIEEDTISDFIFGFILRSTPDKPGFIVNMEGAFGFKIFSGYEDINIVEVELDFGYRFKAIPLAIMVGYGAWGYYKPTSEVDEHYNNFYHKIMRSIEGQDNLAHGPVLRISYSF